MSFWRNFIGGYDAHERFLWAAIAAAVAGLISARYASPLVGCIITWNVFAAATTLLCLLKMFVADARTSVQDATLQDSSRSAIFIFVVVASIAALVSAALLLGTTKTAGTAEKGIHALLAMVTVISSWVLIHTVFALHYTHVFYRCETHGKSQKDHGGLSFPDDEHPGFLDFAYFSFVIGMTCQVSDVQITSKRLRRLALGHGLLSFAFNTIILAMTVNLSSSLVSS